MFRYADCLQMKLAWIKAKFIGFYPIIPGRKFCQNTDEPRQENKVKYNSKM